MLLALFCFALLCYALAALGVFFALMRAKNYPWIMHALLCAIALHAVWLIRIMTLYGINFNVFYVFSLSGLIFAAFFALFYAYRPIFMLGILGVPMGFLGLILGQFGQNTTTSPTPITAIALFYYAHHLLWVLSLCALMMTMGQALLLWLQMRELKRRSRLRFFIERLPSLDVMENLLMDMVLLGFCLLSFTLATATANGLHFSFNMIIATLAWLTFGALMVAHFLGLRGNALPRVCLWCAVPLLGMVLASLWV